MVKKCFAALLLLMLTVMQCPVTAATLGAPQTEHLKISKEIKKKVPTDIVVKTDSLTTIIEHNVLEITFAESFSTKLAKDGDKVSFLLNQGVVTNEGTEIFPQGSTITAVVNGLEKPKWFNRSGKVALIFQEITLPDGTSIPLEAKVFSNKDKLSRSKLSILGKGMGTTLTAMGVGVGAGCGIGVAAGAVIVGGFAIGLPVGVAVGVIAGFVTPGLHYKAKAGDKLFVQLTDDLTVQR